MLSAAPGRGRANGDRISEAGGEFRANRNRAARARWPSACSPTSKRTAKPPYARTRRRSTGGPVRSSFHHRTSSASSRRFRERCATTSTSPPSACAASHTPSASRFASSRWKLSRASSPGSVSCRSTSPAATCRRDAMRTSRRRTWRSQRRRPPACRSSSRGRRRACDRAAARPRLDQRAIALLGAITLRERSSCACAVRYGITPSQRSSSTIDAS